jgi:glutamate--cysteine ligase regulatory subunit
MSDSCSDASNCTAVWQSLIDQLHKLKTFRINTGNINNYVQLKLKKYANSAEELGACLDLQFKNLPENTQVGENGILLLTDKAHRDTEYERDDLKITLKIFVEQFEFSYINDAIETALEQLKIDVIEQLILTFPQTSDSNDASAPVDVHWFSEVLRIWNEVSTKLVANGKVFSVGVADFQLGALKKLYESASTKPCVNHFNIEGCCVVPPELQNFAREHEIQLLTHNDPNPYPLKDVFRSFCGSNKSDSAAAAKSVCCNTFEPVWAARYTIWVRRRSLMAAKGYIVQFKSAV